MYNAIGILCGSLTTALSIFGLRASDGLAIKVFGLTAGLTLLAVGTALLASSFVRVQLEKK